MGSSIRKQSKDVWNKIVEEINKKKGGKDKERENISHRQRKREREEERKGCSLKLSNRIVVYSPVLAASFCT